MTSVSDICAGIPRHCIDSTVSDTHVADIVNGFTEWELMAPYLDLSRSDEHDIKDKYLYKPKLQRREALRLWKQRNGSKATYRKLIEIFCHQGRVDVAERVRDLTQQTDS